MGEVKWGGGVVSSCVIHQSTCVALLSKVSILAWRFSIIDGKGFDQIRNNVIGAFIASAKLVGSFGVESGFPSAEGWMCEM